MAHVEIREHIMAFEPDKCRHCGALFAGVKVGDTHSSRPFSDVTVSYDCGSEDWFTTWYGPTAGVSGVIGIHVGKIGDDPVYIRRVLSQKGDCFERENAQLKTNLGLAQERVLVLEAVLRRGDIAVAKETI